GRQEVADALELGAGALALARREAGGDHRTAQLLALGDADPALIDLRAAAPAGREQLVAQRIEDHRVQRIRALAQRDRHAPVGEAAQVVAGAVQRVDDPGVTTGAAALLRAASLAEHGVLGVGAAQLLDNRLLGQAVDLAGVVHALLLDHVQGVEAVHVAQQDVAPGARRLDHDIDSGLLHRGGLRAHAGSGRKRTVPAPGPALQFTIRA